MGVLLGLLGLVVSQSLFGGLLAAVGLVPLFLGLCAGCFFCIQLVFEIVRLLVQGVQNGFRLVIVGGFGVLQNRADVSSFECHVIVLSALARAAMLGNKVYLPDVLPVWCRLWGLNPRPPDYKSGALPT